MVRALGVSVAPPVLPDDQNLVHYTDAIFDSLYTSYLSQEVL
jgi:hypothetical protein